MGLSWMMKGLSTGLIVVCHSSQIHAEILRNKHHRIHSVHHMPLHRLKRERTETRRAPSINTNHENRNTASTTSDPLFPGRGTHFTYIYVGTPPQRISVIIDTGSYRTAFPCDPCTSCGDYLHYHESGPFLPDDSSTFVSTGHRYTQQYSEGDGWTGVKAYDQTYIGGETIDEYPEAADYAVNYELYCQDEIDGYFVTQLADGIMGLAMSSSSAVQQLVAGGKLDHNSFSLCLAENGGTMSLGGTAQHLWTSNNMQYVAMKPHNTIYYGVTVTDILIGSSTNDFDASIGGSYGSEGSYIVDSGTTFTYLPVGLQSKFVAKWFEATGIPYDTEQPMTEWGDFEGFPDITIMLKSEGKKADDVAYVFQPQNYLDKYCPVATLC
jgi:hypothetical protein